MNIQELITKLQKYPPDLEVVIDITMPEFDRVVFAKVQTAELVNGNNSGDKFMISPNTWGPVNE